MISCEYQNDQYFLAGGILGFSMCLFIKDYLRINFFRNTTNLPLKKKTTDSKNREKNISESKDETILALFNSAGTCEFLPQMSTILTDGNLSKTDLAQVLNTHIYVLENKEIIQARKAMVLFAMGILIGLGMPVNIAWIATLVVTVLGFLTSIRLEKIDDLVEEQEEDSSYDSSYEEESYEEEEFETEQVDHVITAEEQELFETLQEEKEEREKETKMAEIQKKLDSMKFYNPSGSTKYALTDDIANRNLEYLKIKESITVKRDFELSNLERLRKRFENKPYSFVKENIEQTGGVVSRIHPLYINKDPKFPLEEYSNKTVGVRVSDPDYNYKTKEFSEKAIVTHFVDIGGVDRFDRGKIMNF